MVRFDNVGMRYGSGPEVLRDVSFALAPGSFHFLTGARGAGKSTLLRLLYLFEARHKMGTPVVAAPHNEQLIQRFPPPTMHHDKGELTLRRPPAGAAARGAPPTRPAAASPPSRWRGRRAAIRSRARGCA